MKFTTPFFLLLGIGLLSPDVILGSDEHANRRAKHSSSKSGSLKGTAANRASGRSSSGKGASKKVKIIYVPYIPTGEAISNPPISEDEESTESSDDPVKIVYYVPVTEDISTRSGSEDEEAIAYTKTHMPTNMPSAEPSVAPSTVPSTTPTPAPSATPTDERWCNMEYERGCRDQCFKERGCGLNEGCKKKCRKQCCSWD